MTVNLTCTQVSALLSFYIEDKLSAQLKQFVESHLESCPACRAKLAALESMVASLREVHEKLATIRPSGGTNDSSQCNELKVNLSAYVDNELSDEENIKIKKYIISNPKIRQELEDLYKLRKVLQTSFEKTKQESKEDYSKLILRQVDIQQEIYGPDSFAKVVALFIMLTAVFTITALIIFWV